jgi:hypothetical protein
MRAFLSHSSQDKVLVDAVFRSLGSYSGILDSESFEDGHRSADEIFRTLAATDAFVLFLSKFSLESHWVQYELKVAHEQYASGAVRRFLVFLIDETPAIELPAWLRSFHVSAANKAPTIARRIRSHLIDLRLSTGAYAEIFIGREALLKELMTVLSQPPDEGPSIIALAGWPGIGRRTLARKLLSQAYPYLPLLHPEFAVSPGDSLEEFFRKLLDVGVGLSLRDWKTEQARFSTLTDQDKTQLLTDKILDLADSKEILFVVDEGGLLNSNGEYEGWFGRILANMPRGTRPRIILIQRRMMPFAKRRLYPSVYPVHVPSFADDDIRTMLGLLLRQYEVSYHSSDINELMDYLGGHPLNVRFAVESAKQYGLPAVIRDKSELVNFSLERATDVLLTVKLSDDAERAAILLSDYQALDIASIINLLGIADEQAVQALKYLEENAISERSGKYYRIAPYLVEAISRHLSRKHSEWRAQVAKQIQKYVGTYKDEDDIPLSLINASAIVALKADSAKEPSGWIARFILPSHLLRVARDAYDDGDHALAAIFCEKALKRAAAMTVDAQVETLRLLTMSYARLAKETEFKIASERLRAFHTK